MSRRVIAFIALAIPSAALAQGTALAIDTWGLDNLVQFPADNPYDMTLINEDMNIFGGSVEDVDLDPSGNLLYGAMLTNCCEYDDEIFTYDVSLGAIIDFQNVSTESLWALAVDPVTGIVYYIDAYMNCLETWDPNEGTTQLVGSIDGVGYGFIDLAIDNEGQMYGVNYDGNMYAIDKATAIATFITNINARPSMDFDPETNELYAAVYWLNDDPDIYARIDPGNGAITEIAKLADLPDFNGGNLSMKLAIRAAQPCKADCDANGVVNILDFVCFQQLFKAGDPKADCNADGFLFITDFVCFQMEYKLNCN
jgi:hypothetical protein